MCFTCTCTLIWEVIDRAGIQVWMVLLLSVLRLFTELEIA